VSEADTAGTGKQYVDSYEDVSMFALAGEREQTLLDTQTECTFMWTTRDGDPVGVIMNFVAHDGRIWVTCTRRRKRVAAVEARHGVPAAVMIEDSMTALCEAVEISGSYRRPMYIVFTPVGTACESVRLT
jgi:hypothetical protein